MPSSVLFPNCHITDHQQADSEARASLSPWWGLGVSTPVPATNSVPWGEAFPLCSGSLITPKELGWTNFTCPTRNYILRCYLNAASQTYTPLPPPFTYCTNHGPQSRHSGYMNFQPHPHLLGLLIVLGSSPDFFPLTSNFITNSPQPFNPLCSLQSPNAPATFSPPCFCLRGSCIAILSPLLLGPYLSLGWEDVGRIPGSFGLPHVYAMSPEL